MSLFKSTLKAFLVSLFACLGIVAALILIIVGIAGLCSLSESGVSSDSKILTDAHGSRKELASTTPIILQIDIKGEIGPNKVSATKVENALLKSREGCFKNRVKALFLVINSPGGDVNDSDIIYRYLMRYKNEYKVPVYAFVDGMCASGGYYIALAADKIYASEVSLVGSIGVLAWPPFFNVNALLEKLGVNTLTLIAGEGKDELNPTRPWKKDEGKNYQELINFFYGRFVHLATTARPQIDKTKLENAYGARVFPATLAQEYGFIDQSVFCREKALQDLAEAAGLKADEKYQVVTIESKEWLKKLLQEKPFFLSGEIKHTLELPQEFKISGPHPLRYYYQP